MRFRLTIKDKSYKWVDFLYLEVNANQCETSILIIMLSLSLQ
jgi:hypothetical protein